MNNKLSRKDRERAAREQYIIDAAEQVVQQHGFEKATMDEIAEKAEVGKGTLYLHFDNKSSIYLAICKRGSTLLNQRLSKVITSEITGLEMIKELGQAYFSFIQTNPLYFNAFTYYESLFDENSIDDNEIAQQCEENAAEAMTYIVRAIQIGMQDKSIESSIDPRELGLIIWGASKGVMQMSHLRQRGRHSKMFENIEFNIESLVHGFIELVVNGMKNMTNSQN